MVIDKIFKKIKNKKKKIIKKKSYTNKGSKISLLFVFVNMTLLLFDNELFESCKPEYRFKIIGE